MNLAVFASGRGSNFRAIADHARLRVLDGVQISLLVTNDDKAPAINIANEHSIPHILIEGVYGRKFDSKIERERARNEFDERALDALKQHHVDLVALAGFMQVLGSSFVNAFHFRIMNIHPAKDLVRFGGAGMFGERVHEAVLRAGERQSACTVHYVDESVDGGPIIIQSMVPVRPDDTAESLAGRVLIQEHRTYSKAIQLHADNRIAIRNGKTVVDLSGGWENQWNSRQEAFIKYQSAQMTDELLRAAP